MRKHDKRRNEHSMYSLFILYCGHENTKFCACGMDEED